MLPPGIKGLKNKNITYSTSLLNVWDKVFKSVPGKIFGRQPSKNFNLIGILCPIFTPSHIETRFKKPLKIGLFPGHWTHEVLYQCLIYFQYTYCAQGVISEDLLGDMFLWN